MQPEHNAALALPAPDEASIAHSYRVAEYIRERIAEEGGSISFAEFMQHALYAPGLGYYMSGTRKFGGGGDYLTAPEISPLFGWVVARQTATVLQRLQGGDVLEVGAGSGALAASMLDKLSRLDALPTRYCILEISPDLKERQQKYLLEHTPQHSGRAEWLSDLPHRFSGVIVINEVADALPFERFVVSGGEIQQARVIAEDQSFKWHHEKAPDRLADAVMEVEKSIGRKLPDDYRSEICLALKPWIGDIVTSMREGLMLLFDYGVTRREYYAPDRSSGWLRCHFRHRAHENPLILPGIQDLTSAVDFTAVADAAVEAGAEIAGFVTQAHFLIHGGLAEELADFASLPADKQVELSRQVKLLTLPGEMGENVKCIGLSRGDIAPPAALREFDRTHML